MAAWRVPRNLLRLGASCVPALGLPTGATVLIALLSRQQHIPNVSLLYVPAILAVAAYAGAWPSLLASAVAAVEYDYFLLPPLHRFVIQRPGDILALLVFVVVAAPTAQLAALIRKRAETLERQAWESALLFELAQALVSSHDVTHILQALTARVVSGFGVDRCAVFVPGELGRLELVAETIDGARDRASEGAATYAFQQGAEVSIPVEGAGDGRRRLYIPLRSATRVLGVMEVGQKTGKRRGHGGQGELLDASERRLLSSFAAQVTLAVERARSEVEHTRLAVVEESDRLKSALLSAVSHDLRSPLASIKASATSLLLANGELRADEGREMLRAIDHEADRLNRLVGNLLDLSRIEAGVLHPNLDWYHISEVIAAAMRTVQPLATDRVIRIEIEDGIPPVQVDLLRMEELLVNLLENALKYTPSDTPIEVVALMAQERLELRIVDHGQGIPERYRARVFEAFYQVGGNNDRAPGSGLGLAIARGVAEVHGGSIATEDTPGGGATFVVRLPVIAGVPA